MVTWMVPRRWAPPLRVQLANPVVSLDSVYKRATK
jgi:hypothetical protein